MLHTDTVGSALVANLTPGFPTGAAKLSFYDQSTRLDEIEITLLLPYHYTAPRAIEIP